MTKVERHDCVLTPWPEHKYSGSRMCYLSHTHNTTIEKEGCDARNLPQRREPPYRDRDGYLTDPPGR